MENVNTIEKMEFQVQLDSERTFHILSDEISKVITEKLEDFIDKTLLDFGVQHQQIIIPRIELDLGELSLAYFKEDLVERFQSLFQKSLQQVIQAPQVSTMSPSQRAFYVIVYYIKFGSRPWWLEKEGKQLEDFFHFAFKSNPAKLQRLLFGFFQNLKYRKRMMDALSENLLTLAVSHQYQVNKDFFNLIKTTLKKYDNNASSYQISLAFKNLLIFLYFQKNNIKNELQINDTIVQVLYNYPSINLPYIFRQQVALFKKQGKEFWDQQLPLEKETVLVQENFKTKEMMLFNWLHFYLENGFFKPEKSGAYYNFRNINYLFSHLLKTHPQSVIGLLLQIGRQVSVKKRFLEKISQENIASFFSKVAPTKKKFAEWVFDVFEHVQDEYQPINQTFTQVKKSINNIIFEIFLSGKLSGINDENYLRLIFKQTAAKYGIKYEDLLSLTIKALSDVKNNNRLMRFYQTLSSILNKDILHQQPYFIKNLEAKDSKKSKSINASTTEENLSNLRKYFLSLAQSTSQSSSFQLEVNTWLQSKVKSSEVLKAEAFISVLEAFTTKFNIPLIRGILPVLLAQSSQPSLKLPRTVFENFKKKFQLIGLEIGKNSNPNSVVDALFAHQKSFEKKYLIKVLLNLQVKNDIQKVNFQKISLLVFSKPVNWIPQYLAWVEKVSLQQSLVNKSDLLFWFYHQLLITKSSSLSLKYFKDLTVKYLQNKAASKNQSFSNVAFTKNLDLQSESSLVDFTNNMMQNSSSKSQLPLQAFFDILGREEIVSLISNVRKIEDHYLLQLMLTKYKSQFFDILLNHQFNDEFKQYILEEAPTWLRKQVLRFLMDQSGFEFEKQAVQLQKIFSQNDWIDLNDLALVHFIEESIWPYFFYKKSSKSHDLSIDIIQEAIKKGFVSKKFISLFLSEEVKNTSVEVGKNNPIISGILESFGEGLKEFLEVKNPLKISDESFLALLKELMEAQQFPKWHPFHEHRPTEFKTYLNKLIRTNPKILYHLIPEIKGKAQLFYLLHLLNDEHVLLLKESWEDHYQLLPNANIPDLLFDLFQIKNQKNRILAIRSGLVKVFFLNKSSLNQTALMKEWLIQLMELGLVTRDKIILQTNWGQFFEETKMNTSSQNEIVKVLSQLLSTDIVTDQSLEEKAPNLISKKSDAIFLSEIEDSFGLLLNISATTWEKFEDLLMKLFKSSEVPKDHQKILSDWLRISKTIDNKKFFQKAIQIYTVKKLWRQKNLKIVENKLFFYITKLLIKSADDFIQFVSEVIKGENHIKQMLSNESLRFQKEIVAELTDRMDPLQRQKVFQSLELWIVNLSSEASFAKNLLLMGDDLQKSSTEALKNISAAELLFSTKNTSIHSYEEFFLQLNQSKQLPQSHSILLKEWVDFAKLYGLKQYLQLIAQTYIFQHLWKENDKEKVQKTLLLQVINAFIGSPRDYQLFQSRIAGFNFKDKKVLEGELKRLAATYKQEEIGNLSLASLNNEDSTQTLDVEEEIKEFLLKGKEAYKKSKIRLTDYRYILNLIGQSKIEEIFKNEIVNIVYGEIIDLKKPQIIEDYFKNLKDPYLIKIQANLFLKDWFEILFQSISRERMMDLVRIFHQTFYLSSSKMALKIENFFMKILQIQFFENSLQKVSHEKPVEFQKFIGFYPNLKGFIQPLEGDGEVNEEEALERFLRYGILPKIQEFSIEDLVARLSKLKSKDLDRLKLSIYRMMQSRQGRESIKKIIPFMKEEWLYGIVHPDLFKNLNAFEKLMKSRVGIDIFSLLRSKHIADRMLLVLSFWSSKRVRLLDPIEILQGLFDIVLDKLDIDTFKVLLALSKKDDKMLTILKNSSAKFKSMADKHIDKKKEAEKKVQEEQEAVDYTDGVNVYNAGLVFYWPFLGRFFTSLELVDKNGMKGEASTERCIQLLQYIATGATDFEEWDLTLNKILCGVEPDFSVSTSFEPTPEEEELCIKLVNATIYNWEKLRGTKPETFRETFVQREGRLYNRDNRWELMVEKKAYDVLLDSLPWSISMITLSWMKTRLLVEWK